MIPTRSRNTRQMFYLGKSLISQFVNTSFCVRAPAWAPSAFLRPREGCSLCARCEQPVPLQLFLITAKSYRSDFHLFIFFFFYVLERWTGSYFISLLSANKNFWTNWYVPFFSFLLSVIVLSTPVYESQNILIQIDFPCPSGLLSLSGLVDAQRYKVISTLA